MSQTLEMPDWIYAALREAAEASGTTPLEWIAARLAEAKPPAGNGRDVPPAPATMADLFAGHIGQIRSGGADRLSERGGEEFADDLERKRDAGCL